MFFRRTFLFPLIICCLAACGSSGSAGSSSSGSEGSGAIVSRSGDGYTPGNGNLHLVDQFDNGFQIYRSGSPARGDFQQWCRLGISEVMVVSGDAGSYERKFSSECPALQVVFDEKQSSSEPLSAGFLQIFDRWVAQAQAQGKRILFRCDCGCHRTGRLAAYYEMKYMGYPRSEAEQDMLRFGKEMDQYPGLLLQVQALEDYIQDRPCSQDAEYCVKSE
jgi:hypothetical protein